MGAYLNEDKLKDFLDRGVCREERQFSALLYYMFLEAKKGKKENENIIKRCLKMDDDSDITIKEVYYEPTLMRDYFDNDKEEFNKKLMNFCVGWMDIEEEKLEKSGILGRNLGQSRAKEMMKEFVWEGEENGIPKDKRTFQNFIKNKIEYEEDTDKVKKQVCFDIAGKMMNAVPDLLVIYENKGMTYAKILECKYLSDEGRYEDVAGISCTMQFLIQECIMRFCFGERKEGIRTGNIIKIVESARPSFTDTKGAFWSEKKKELWEQICGNVYKKILSQDRKWESENVSNAGVMLIKFGKEKERKEWENQGGVFVSIDKELMRVYHSTKGQKE